VCPPTLSRPSQSCLLSVSVHHFINHCSTLIQTPCFNQNNVVCPNPCFTLGATIDKTLFYVILTFSVSLFSDYNSSGQYFYQGPFFCHYVGIQEWCLNAISIDKDYLLGINKIDRYSFSVIS
jgi:hypothetical protein